MTEEILNSQESLPLSQETLSNLYSMVPPNILEEFIKGNLNGNLPVISYVNENLEEVPDRKQIDAAAGGEQISNAKALPQSSLPATEDFPGFFDFSVSLPASNSTYKQPPFVCSTASNILYVRRNIFCPFHFSTSQPLHGYTIRATLYFSSPENAAEVVVRCVDHSFADRDSGDPLYEHLLQCKNRLAMYYKDASNRCSVTVPFENPPIGQSHSTYLFKFTCFSSCSGGPNRRPMCVVFTLENKDVPLARYKVDLKVCSSPYRDCRKNEEPLLSSPLLAGITKENATETARLPTKRKHEDKLDEKEKFTIKLKDEECYKFLRCLQKYYQLHKEITQKHNWTPTVTDVKNILHVLSSGEEK